MEFAQLAAHVGEEFTLAGVPVTLTTATPAGAGGSLVFEGPLDRPLDQATHEIAHPVLGDGLLFVVPVGAGASARTYEAVFN
ncbi:DUF6916 family protein [Nocardioides currus]|uniref:DUF6916 domain-containing protein n=1 Tax=Nocardioides currus TaxID=2133958 RepID=A0A2R7YYB6_9ACTN|nr:hypothetical protein [Nocardioides currus]PUA81372.1 hypothetical protein C7S10_10190 [Nocardioides currus]